jgi:hypothetical protein
MTVNQELSRAGVPGILDVIGIGMLGPWIIAYGSDEQKSLDADRDAAVAVLHGEGGVFCAGADLKAVGSPVK